MKKHITIFILFLFATVKSQTNSFHDTQGKLEISNSGQATYTLPIALPKSIGDVGPVINLVYQSGQNGGIAGQGWNINSISTISRIATRTDIDGFKDGVDFDANDKLALDGQRLLLVSGTYWADGSIYQTEVQSNTKIELKGSGTSIYFIVTAPDGTRSWYGNYGGVNGVDLTAFYIVRFEDTNGNFMTYHYFNPHNGNLCVKEIKFNGNTNGLLATNSILFDYDAAKRKEFAYLKGVKLEKLAILKKIQVKTGGLLFREYRLTHIEDAQLGYERVSQIQEFNSALEASNPIIFEYDTTEMTAQENTNYYYNDIDFNDVLFSGDFDGDNHMDFITSTKAHTRLFQGSSALVTSLPFSPDKRTSFVATTLKDNYLNQFQSIVNVEEEANYILFKAYNKNPDYVPYAPGFGWNYLKAISINNTGTGAGDSSNCTIEPVYTKKSNEYLEGDFDGNGISEVIITSKVNEVKNKLFALEDQTGCASCKYEIDFNTKRIYRVTPYISMGAFNYEDNFNEVEYVRVRGGSPCQKVGYIILDRNKALGGDYKYTYYYYDGNVSQQKVQTYKLAPQFAQYNSKTSDLTDYEIPSSGLYINVVKKCYDKFTDSGKNYYYIDLNQNSSQEFNSNGYTQLDVPNSAIFEGKKYIMDFNGDGKSDILSVKPDKTYILASLQKLNAAPWVQIEIIGQGTLSVYDDVKQILFGDYNGDGKTDIMMPTASGNGCSGCNNWVIYYSNPKPLGGEFFNAENHSIVEYWANTGSTYNKQVHYSNYYALDINKDGKTDLVRVWRKYYKPSWTWNDHNTQWTVSAYTNNIGNPSAYNSFTSYYDSPWNHDSDNNWLPMPIASTFRHNGLNRELVVVQDQDNSATYINFNKDVSKDILLKRVIQSGGTIVDEIEYKTLEPSSANRGYGALSDFYSSNLTFPATYPNVEIIRMPATLLVSKLKTTSLGITKFQDFKYRGFVVNMEGMGAFGFRNTARSSWYQSDSDKKIWSVTTNDPTKRGSQISSYTQLVEGGSNNFSFVLGYYPTDPLGYTLNSYLQPTIVNGLYTLLLDKQTVNDKLTNVITERKYEYSTEGFNLPVTTTTINYLGTTEQGRTVIDTEFENNATGIGNQYYIGRPRTVTTTVTAYQDSKASEEKFHYDTFGNVIKNEKKPLSETYYLTEEYEYNSYGNIERKTVSAPGASSPVVAPRTTEYVYDPSQRFILESKDIENLVTKFTYDNLYGNVLTETNPFNLVTTSVYDNWGKRTKVTDYLGKSISYTYTKSNNEYTTQSVGDDGSNSIVVSNALGQVIRSGKLLINGQWSYKTTEYDYLGRKKKVSEPYFSNESPSLWTTITYDDLGRAIQTVEPSGKTSTVTYNGLTVTTYDGVKTAVATKNANGHVVSSSDNGGEITYEYYADGNLKKTSYAGTEITTEYDLWGRKKKLTDPSAGTYEYYYNAFGQTIEEVNPNGNTTYSYDGVGKITEKYCLGLNIDSYTSYVYDGTTKLLTSSEHVDYENGQTINYYYGYDNYKRPLETVENGSHGSYQRVTLYDAFGRPEKEAYNANVGGKQSLKWIRNTYLNGYHWQILDDSNGAMLWQIDAVNQRNQMTTAHYSNGVGQITNTYDTYGFPTQTSHKTIGGAFASATPFMTLNTVFDAQKGNLTSRTNSMFSISESFKYDNLDRLVSWSVEPAEMVNCTFEEGIDGFEPFENAVLTNDNGQLKVVVTEGGAIKEILASGNAGDVLNIGFKINRGNFGVRGALPKIGLFIREYNENGVAEYNQQISQLISNGTYNYNYTINGSNRKIELYFNKIGQLEDTSSHYFFLDDLKVILKGTEKQEYDERGRITNNSNGGYKYENTDKLYQNTAVELNSKTLAHYQNREGLYNNGMEEGKGWICYAPSGISFDTSKSHTGKKSLKVSNSTTNEKIVFSDSWVSINNSTATQYTYSGWVYSNGPQAEIFLFMKTANETNYYTYYDQIVTNTTNGWVYVEKTFLVPADVKKINVRLDNNGLGTIWFDDIRIRKTSNPTTSERKLDISYNAFKSPYEITETGVDKITFLYNGADERRTMFYGGLQSDMYARDYRKHYSTDGSMEVKHNVVTDELEFITYIGGDAYSAPLIYKSDGTTGEFMYLHRDYLGSIMAVTNANGQVVEKRHFDAWGNIVKVQDGAGNNLQGLTVIDRGYTGHEHLQSVGLIHMNRRLYDPKLHRFLQPDNYVQDPSNTQNYNRYGYVYNNPLKFTDPSGELGFLAVVAIGAAISVATYAITALVADVPFTIGGLLQSAAIGAISSAATFGIGSATSTITNFYVRASVQALAHGTFQGGMTGAQGGNFWTGFASGALSSVAASAWSGGATSDKTYTVGSHSATFTNQSVVGLGGEFAGSTFGTIAFGTVMGGAGASLTGGNFWQGAVTGLVVSGLNHSMHRDTDPPGKKTLFKYQATNDDGLTVEQWENLPILERMFTNRPGLVYGTIEFGPGKGAKYLAKMLAREGTTLVEVKKIGDFWKYTTKTMARNGNGSYTITSKYLNAQGKTIKWFHDTYNKTGAFLHRGYTEGSTKVHLWWNGVKQYGDDFFQTFR